jgi:hypothetical protein
MQLYKYKKLDLGWVILCADHNPSALRTTANSIRRRYDGPIVAAVPFDLPDDLFREMSVICPVFKGGDTITSLINAGMDAAQADWNITVMAGVWARQNLDKKYSYFIENEKDILYAIVDNYYEFPDCSLNGIMVSREAWRSIGHFCPKNPLPICKLFWAQQAIDKGMQLKAVIGVKMI